MTSNESPACSNTRTLQTDKLCRKKKTISAETLESICIVLGGQNTGTQIGYYLAQTGIADTDPGITKWKRLYNAFANYQNKFQESNKIQIFIQKTLRASLEIGRAHV